MPYALVDTGVWYAMFDRADPCRDEVGPKSDRLKALGVIVPWPIMYETLRTRFVRNVVALGQFERFLKRPNIEYLDDSSLRDAAMNLAFESSIRFKRPLSMVDCLLRLLIEDPGTRVDYLVTFNIRDFVDICHKHRVAII